MPTNITDVDTWTSTIVTAADGDAVNGASRETEAQGLSDRTRYLYNRNLGAAGGYIEISILQALQEPQDVTTNRRFYLSAGGVSNLGWGQGSIADQGRLYLGIPQIYGAKLTEIHAMVNGNLFGGGHGGLPTNMPEMSLRRNDSGGSTTNISTVVDPSASVVAYHLDHLISITGQSETFDYQKQWYIEIRGESVGAAAVDTFGWYGCYMKIEAV